MRQPGAEGRHFCVQRSTETQHVACRRHRHRQPDSRFAVHPVGRGRWLGDFPGDGGNVGQRNIAIVNVQRDGAQTLFGSERPADLYRHVLLPGTHRSCRDNGVLRPEGVGNVLNIQPHPGQARRRKGENPLLLLFAQQGGFAHIRQGHEFAPYCLCAIPHLPQREAFGNKGVNCAERVVKLVIHGRTLHPFGQGRRDVLHFFANLIPDIGHALRGRIVTEVDVDNGASGTGFTFEIVQPGRFLQLFFKRIGQQAGGIRHGGSRPLCGDDGRFNGECRIFVTRQLLIAEHAHRNHQQHEKADHLLVLQRPGGEVKFCFRSCVHG